MNTLKITQTHHNGHSKIWRLNSQSKQLTFGSSRKADINSIDPSVQSFEAVIEFKNSEWHFITFSVAEHPADLIIQDGAKFSLSNSMLSFEIISKKLDLLQNLNQISNIGNQKNNLIILTHNSKILEISVLNVNTKFSLFAEGQKQMLDLTTSADWTQSEIKGYTIKSKTISTEDISALSKNNEHYEFANESNKPLFIALGITTLIIASALLISKPEPSKPMTKILNSTVIVVKNNLKKIKKDSSKSASKSSVPAVASSGGASNAKVTALLKGAIGLRISQLLGKVSATEARTANVLVTRSGVKAGEGPSGRALAAVGKVESSGRNWTGETVGTGAGVSTSGIGGGKGTGSLGGGLGQGKTGSGGVGLIEDESEIVGGLDREIIAQYIKTQLGQILYCYERQLSANPNLYGKIAVKFTIAGSGQVETQAINDTTLKNLSVESCILNKISKWKFPEPKGGTKVLVTYPFLFKSTI